MEQSCEWALKDIGWSTTLWNTSCEESFLFGGEGVGPEDNNFRYCPYCGRQLREDVEDD